MSIVARTTGFWSYSREDDRSDKGRIRALASDLMAEFNLIAGHPLNVFVDREAIEWGQEWRSRIDSSLTEATFLIAIITPRFFRREECRRELLEFYGQAKSSGLEKLLCPILYIDVADLTPGNDDEVMSIVARTQQADWRELRLGATDSAEYRSAVNKLAIRILKIEGEVTSALIERESRLPVDEPGVSETVEAIQKRLPAWQESVLGDPVNRAQFNATYEQHMDRISRLQARRVPRSAILAAELRLGPDLLPLVERRLRDAQIYLSRSAELDPLVLRLIRQIKEYPRGADLATDITFAIDTAIENIAAEDKLVVHRHYILPLTKLSQTMGNVYHLILQSEALIGQGNEIVGRWWNAGIGTLAAGADDPAPERGEHRRCHRSPADGQPSHSAG